MLTDNIAYAEALLTGMYLKNGKAKQFSDPNNKTPIDSNDGIFSLQNQNDLSRPHPQSPGKQKRLLAGINIPYIHSSELPGEVNTGRLLLRGVSSCPLLQAHPHRPQVSSKWL